MFSATSGSQRSTSGSQRLRWFVIFLRGADSNCPFLWKTSMPDTDLKTGADLSAWRARNNRTQESLASELDVTRQTVIQWEQSANLTRMLCLALEALELKRPVVNLETGAHLREWRKRRNRTQEQLANELGVKKERIAYWEQSTTPLAVRLRVALRTLDLVQHVVGLGMSEAEQKRERKRSMRSLIEQPPR
jgi:transcriptional regulator with XRE-family HTH domain